MPVAAAAQREHLVALARNHLLVVKLHPLPVVLPGPADVVPAVRAAPLVRENCHQLVPPCAVLGDTYRQAQAHVLDFKEAKADDPPVSARLQ